MLDNGRYRVLDVIGAGGYASVYRAIDLQFNLERAIKEVVAPDEGVRKQFDLEAEVLLNIDSPNVPRAYKIFNVGRRIYFVMEFVQGKDLEELLNDSLVQRHRALDEAQTLQWAIEICDALSQLHNMRPPVIHRDIKPANIKITPQGHPVLIDFGLAKLHEQSKQTQAAAQGVSPGFAPPEQYMAKGRTDARTDVYGMGATLYACLTGKDPAEAPARLLAQTGVHHGTSLEPPRKHNSHISDRTERVILKALELAPGKRQQSARELRDELRQALQVLLTGAVMAPTQVMPQGAPPRPADAPRIGNPDPLSPKRPIVPPPASLGQGGKRGPSPQAPRPVASPIAGPMAAVAAGGAAAAAAFAAATSGRQQAIKVDQRAAQKPVAGPAPQTAKQPVVNAADTGQHRTLASSAQEAANRSSGKHPVVKQPLVGANGAQHPVLEAKDTNARMLAVASGAATAVAEREVKPGASGKRPAVKGQVASQSLASSGAWIRFGSKPLTRFGKWMLALAALETIWGVAALSAGVVALTNHGVLAPSLGIKLGVGWAIVAIVVALLGGQALSRPAYRRGHLNGLRRTLQGMALFLFSALVHAVALWGATIFASTQGDATLEVAAYTIFGVNVLVVGIVSLITVLG